MGPSPFAVESSEVAFESISLRISLHLRTTLLHPIERRGLALLRIEDQLEYIADTEPHWPISKGIVGMVQP